MYSFLSFSRHSPLINSAATPVLGVRLSAGSFAHIHYTFGYCCQLQPLLVKSLQHQPFKHISLCFLQWSARLLRETTCSIRCPTGKCTGSLAIFNLHQWLAWSYLSLFHLFICRWLQTRKIDQISSRCISAPRWPQQPGPMVQQLELATQHQKICCFVFVIVSIVSL